MYHSIKYYLFVLAVMLINATYVTAQTGDIDVTGTLQGLTSVSQDQAMDFGVLLGGTTKEIDPIDGTVTSNGGVIGGETRGIYSISFNPNPGSAIIKVEVDTMLTSSGNTMAISYIDSSNSNKPYMVLVTKEGTSSGQDLSNITDKIVEGENAAFDGSTPTELGTFTRTTVGDKHVFTTDGYITDLHNLLGNKAEGYYLVVGGKVYVDANQAEGDYKGSILITTTYTETDQQQ